MFNKYIYKIFSKKQKKYLHFERKCYILTKSVEGNNKKRNQTTETKEYGQLVKGLRRRPLTAETRVRFPYWLLRRSSQKPYSNCFFHCSGSDEKQEYHQKCHQNMCYDYFFAFFSLLFYNFFVKILQIRGDFSCITNFLFAESCRHFCFRCCLFC